MSNNGSVSIHRLPSNTQELLHPKLSNTNMTEDKGPNLLNNNSIVSFLFVGHWTNWLHILRFCGVDKCFCCVNEQVGISPILKEHYDVTMFAKPTLHKYISENSVNNNNVLLFLFEGPSDYVFPNVEYVHGILLSSNTTNTSIQIATLTKRIRSYTGLNNAAWIRVSHHKDCGGSNCSRIPNSGDFKISYNQSQGCRT